MEEKKDALGNDNDADVDLDRQRQKVLLAATQKLERNRSLQSEREASLLFSSHLLSHPFSEIISSQLKLQQNSNANSSSNNNPNGTNSIPDDDTYGPSFLSSKLPGGVLDAHAALVDSCLPSFMDEKAFASGSSGGNDPTTIMAESIATGQLAQMCKQTALSTALTRASQVSSLLHSSSSSSTNTNNKNKDTDGKDINEDHQTYQTLFQLMTAQTETPKPDDLDLNESNDPLKPWFECFYTRLRDIREYHAKHDTANNATIGKNNYSAPLFPVMPSDYPEDRLSTINVTTTTTPTHMDPSALSEKHKKRIRKGNPEADGYDLSSLLTLECQKMTEGGMFSGEEVLGKYLDLNVIHDYVIQKGISSIFQSGVNHLNNKSSSVDKLDNSDVQSTKSISYVDFLSILLSGLSTTLPESLKLNHRKKYVKFLQMMQDYLHQFITKTFPLLNIETDIVNPSMKQFDLEWGKQGGVTGWEHKKHECAMVGGETVDDSNSSEKDQQQKKEGLDLSPYNNPEELEAKVDKDVLKTELSRLGLKCGGTPLDRAKRLFLTKNTPLDQLPKKLFVKRNSSKPGATTPTAPANNNATTTSTPAPKVGGNNSEYSMNTGNERRIDIARLETIVTAFLHQLRPTLDATARRADRRLTQTANERDREIQEEIYGTITASASSSNKRQKKDGDENDNEDDDDDEDEDSDEEAPIYNPKGVPLGWDGKPIPYWLFKLHGLNHFFPCEICGGESYRGRRNFEKHFTESKHAYGMRCLGIPNTKHFHGVTKIEDALKLWEKLKGTVEGNVFDGGKDEEYEDSHGNVLKRGEYEDLARQGLL